MPGTLAHTSSLSYSGGRGKKNTLFWDLDSHLGYIIRHVSKKNYNHESKPNNILKQAMIHAYNPSTWEAETGELL